MIGVQTPFAPVPIPGKLYYLRDGNIWKIEGSTANRQAVLTLGDLDGRIFTISSDGSWVLFTRRSQEEGQINSLWAAQIGPESGPQATARPTLAPGEAPTEQEPVDLRVKNVIHFADFIPGSNTKIVFSTVEPREAAPGWQANNDLNALTFSTSGWTTKWTNVMEANAGGVYGWWGTSFLWGPDGRSLAYARPDSIGIVDYKSGSITTTLNIIPLQTHGDWAWVPGITWGPDGNALYTLDHVAPQGATDPEESTAFDLTAALFQGGPTLHLVSQTGMFAYPLASPLQDHRRRSGLPAGLLAGAVPRPERDQPLPGDGDGPGRLEPADALPAGGKRRDGAAAALGRLVAGRDAQRRRIDAGRRTATRWR